MFSCLLKDGSELANDTKKCYFLWVCSASSLFSYLRLHIVLSRPSLEIYFEARFVFLVFFSHLFLPSTVSTLSLAANRLRHFQRGSLAERCKLLQHGPGQSCARTRISGVLSARGTRVVASSSLFLVEGNPKIEIRHISSFKNIISEVLWVPPGYCLES